MSNSWASEFRTCCLKRYAGSFIQWSTGHSDCRHTSLGQPGQLVPNAKSACKTWLGGPDLPRRILGSHSELSSSQVCSAQVLWKLLLPLRVESRASEAASGYIGSNSLQPFAQPLAADYLSLPEAELSTMLEKKRCPSVSQPTPAHYRATEMSLSPML